MGKMTESIPPMSDATSFRLQALEHARDRLTTEIDVLRHALNGHEVRLVAAETMQPVIMSQLEEIKQEVIKGNAFWSKVGWLFAAPVVGFIVYWITNGGMSLPIK